MSKCLHVFTHCIRLCKKWGRFTYKETTSMWGSVQAGSWNWKTFSKITCSRSKTFTMYLCLLRAVMCAHVSCRYDIYNLKVPFVRKRGHNFRQEVWFTSFLFHKKYFVQDKLVFGRENIEKTKQHFHSFLPGTLEIFTLIRWRLIFRPFSHSFPSASQKHAYAIFISIWKNSV